MKKVCLPYTLGETPLAMFQNATYARNRQGQVNHITGEVYYIALALKKSSTVLTIHDIDSLGSTHRVKNLLLHLFWLHLPVRRARFVTVVSEYSKMTLMKATRITADKVIVIPNCVLFTEADFKPACQINKLEPVLLQVGTKANKNLENLVMAINGIPCMLILIGPLSEEQVQLLTTAHIRYENYTDLAYADVKALYYKADIVTFVSTYEGFGMPILEANSLGRPVITSMTTSMPEVAGEGALFVDPYKPEELRQAILKLVENDTLRNELVAAGYKNAQRFKPEAVAALYENLYERVLEESR